MCVCVCVSVVRTGSVDATVDGVASAPSPRESSASRPPTAARVTISALPTRAMRETAEPGSINPMHICYARARALAGGSIPWQLIACAESCAAKKSSDFCSRFPWRRARADLAGAFLITGALFWLGA